ncbi:MAG: hypothetical protein V3U02_02345 [Calditrichia bacterium]
MKQHKVDEVKRLNGGLARVGVKTKIGIIDLLIDLDGQNMKESVSIAVDKEILRRKNLKVLEGMKQ